MQGEESGKKFLKEVGFWSTFQTPTYIKTQRASQDRPPGKRRTYGSLPTRAQGPGLSRHCPEIGRDGWPGLADSVERRERAGGRRGNGSYRTSLRNGSRPPDDVCWIWRRNSDILFIIETPKKNSCGGPYALTIWTSRVRKGCIRSGRWNQEADRFKSERQAGKRIHKSSSRRTPEQILLKGWAWKKDMRSASMNHREDR